MVTRWPQRRGRAGQAEPQRPAPSATPAGPRARSRAGTRHRRHPGPGLHSRGPREPLGRVLGVPHRRPETDTGRGLRGRGDAAPARPSPPEPADPSRVPEIT